MFGDLHIHMILDGVYYRAAIDAQKEHPLDGLAARGCLIIRRAGSASCVTAGTPGASACGRGSWRGNTASITAVQPFPSTAAGTMGSSSAAASTRRTNTAPCWTRQGEKRADFIKLMISGLIDFDHFGVLTEPGPEPQDIRRMIELAHAAGFAVMAHANGDRAVTAALQAGVDSIEHGAYLSESVLLRMAQQRTLWVPTLSTIGNLIGSGRYPDAVLRRLLAQQQEAVRFVAAHGGRIGLGSDAGAWHVMHGQAISDELGYLTAALGPRTEPLLLEAEAYASVTFCRK